MNVIEAERLAGTDRRRWPRAAVRLALRVVDTDDSFRVIIGGTLDVGVGGVRAVLDGPLFGTLEVTLHLELGERPPLVCEALVVDGHAVDDGWEYRLAFRNLDPHEVVALADVAAVAAWTS